jgi:acyl-CoA synthetase (AMP-forming)/AMP-acid ligase II
MGKGYFRDHSSKSFQDGWFFPGDLGYFTETGGLMLSGRDGERINRGGVKIDPVVLDQFLLDCPGVEDAAVFEDVGQADRPRLAAVVVASPGVLLEPLREAIQRKFGVARSPSLFTKVDAIPRNAMGKVSRQELQARFSDRGTAL